MNQSLLKNGLDGTQLKMIALVLMVLDHVHYFFGFTGVIPEAFSMAARMSAPLFLFCTAEGFAHTHDRKRYFLRIWAIAAGMGAIEFFMRYAHAFRRGNDFYPQNAIFQDFVLLCIVWQGMDWLWEKKLVRGTAAIVAVVGWPFFIVFLLQTFPQLQSSALFGFVVTSPLPTWSSITDGGWGYLLGGVVLYALRNHRKAQIAAWGISTFLTEFVMVWLAERSQPDFVRTQMFSTYYEWFGIGAAVLMLLYNGQRGSGHKRLFYWFYPAHVYLLYGASCLLYNVLR